MDDLNKSHKPIIPSLLSANKDAEKQKSRTRLEATDKSGLRWRIVAKNSQVPSPINPRILIWKIDYWLSSQCSVADLIEASIIQYPVDQRLGSILESIEPIIFETAHTSIAAENEQDLYKLANRSIRDCLQESEGQDFYSLKRAFLYKMIEDKCSFI